MASSKVERRKLIDKTLTAFGVVATLALFAIGGLAFWGYIFTTNNVRTNLADQGIFFPQVESPAFTSLPAADKAQVAKYAGLPVLNGDQAKVFANNYIAVHLKEVAGGQTYAQVSAAALKDPTNAKLQGQANTLFKGETLRGLLLGDAYAFWTVGIIAKDAAIVAFVAGGVMAVLTLLGFLHLSRL